MASSRTTDLDHFCSFAERFLTDESGRPLVIEGFQREILADYFAGTRELVVVLSKKNGKTNLFAALALWHVIMTPFADVAILAASRDQAGKLLQQLTGYIKRSSALREQLRIIQRVVHCDRTDGKVAVLASDSDTLDGWGGTLALIDELARHKSDERPGLHVPRLSARREAARKALGGAPARIRSGARMGTNGHWRDCRLDFGIGRSRGRGRGIPVVEP